MTEASECLRLQPGERVLWQGRAAVGAPWPSAGRVLAAASLALVVLVLPPLALGARELAGGLAVLVTLITAVVLVSKLVGDSYVVIGIVLVVAPTFAVVWLDRLRSQGSAAAFSEQAIALAPVVALLVGMPLVILTVDVLQRLNTVYVITDRRVAALLLHRGLIEWDEELGPADSIDCVTSWDAPGGYLVVRWQHHGRALHLRDDDPATVLVDIRRARAR